MRAAFAPLLLAACGPLTVAEAEHACAERAWYAEGPHGTAEIGVDSRGRVRSGVGVTLTSDYIMGRDPSALYDACVFQKSGQPPTRPYYARSDRKG